MILYPPPHLPGPSSPHPLYVNVILNKIHSSQKTQASLLHYTSNVPEQTLSRCGVGVSHGAEQTDSDGVQAQMRFIPHKHRRSYPTVTHY